jgi:hypothetical protein
MDYYDDIDIYEELEERPRDPTIDHAIERLKGFFDASPQRLFYSTQIETSLEREFFHWITGKALLELANSNQIKRESIKLHGQNINFYASRKHRYIQRELKSMLGLLNRIFDPEFTHAIGRHGELMFDAALGRNGFRAETSNTNSWNGKTWQETNHNLDRIVTRDGIAYGIEIKNTQNYIPRIELQIKLRICHYLGVIPLFIMRFAPKSYMYQIHQASGFGLLFEDQIYPWGHTALLAEVRERLGLKVNCPRNVKEGDMLRLVKWHIKQVGKQ